MNVKARGGPASPIERVEKVDQGRGRERGDGEERERGGRGGGGAGGDPRHSVATAVATTLLPASVSSLNFTTALATPTQPATQSATEPTDTSAIAPPTPPPPPPSSHAI